MDIYLVMALFLMVENICHSDLFLTKSIEVRLFLIDNSTVNVCSLLVVSFRMSHKSATSYALLRNYGLFSIIVVVISDVIMYVNITTVSNDRVNSK